MHAVSGTFTVCPADTLCVGYPVQAPTIYFTVGVSLPGDSGLGNFSAQNKGSFTQWIEQLSLAVNVEQAI